MRKLFTFIFSVICMALCCLPVMATLTIQAQWAPTAKSQYPNAPFVVTASGNGTTVTCTYTTAPPVATNQLVTIANSGVSAWNGTQQVTGVSGNTFTFANTTSGTSAPVSMTATDEVTNQTFTISAIVCDGTTETVTTSTTISSANLLNGDLVYITGASPGGLNGYYTATLKDPNTFNVANTTITGSASAGMTVTPLTYVQGTGSFTFNAGCGWELPAGPRLTGDSTADSYGWSMGTTPVTQAYQDYATVNMGTNSASLGPGLSLTTGQQQLNTSSCFYDINNYPGNTGYIYQDITSNSTVVWGILIGTNGDFWYITGGGVTTTIQDSGVVCPLSTHFELRNSVQVVTLGSSLGTSSWNFFAAYRVAGTSTWNTIEYLPAAETYVSGQSPVAIKWGLRVNSGATLINMRWGLPELFTVTNWATDCYPTPTALSTLSPAVIDPAYPTGGYTWYYDPANYSTTAADTNTGTDATHPLLSQNHITNLGEFAGFIWSPANGAYTGETGGAWQQATNGAANGTSFNTVQDPVNALLPAYQSGTAVLTGDTLVINNNAGAECRMPEQALFINTNGITVKSSGGTNSPVTLTRFHIEPAASWTLVTGTTYENADSDPYACLLEDRRTLILATSLLNCEATAGSYWPTASEMYVNPASASSPGTNGHVYERTEPGFNSFAIGGLTMNANSFIVQGINVSGTLETQYDGGYCFVNNITSGQGNSTGNLEVYDTCLADSWDKHGFGSVGNTCFNNRTLYVNCTAQGGNNLGTSGNGTSYVDYTTAGGNDLAGYFNCTLGSGAQRQVGSNQYTSASPNQTAIWVSHGVTAGVVAEFINSPLLVGSIYPEDSDIVSVTGSTLAQSAGYTPATSVYNNDTILGNPGPGTFNNCILIITPSNTVSGIPMAYHGILATPLNAVFNNCTIDVSRCGSSAVFNTTAGYASMTFNNCLILLGTGPLIENTVSTDAVVTNNCEFQCASSQNILQNYLSAGNLTLAGMVTNSIDTSSATITSASIGSNYKRTAQSSITSILASPISLASCTTTTTSATITTSSTSGVYAGQSVAGTGIPYGSYVVSYVANTSITINTFAMASGTVTLTLGLANDYTGVTLANRKTIGAYEYIPASPGAYAIPPSSSGGRGRTLN